MASPLHNIQVGTQISVFTDNKPGRLAGVTRVLSDNGINILGLTVLESLDNGYIRLVVDRTDEAVRLLEEADFLLMTRRVVLLEMDNRAGSLHEVFERWGKQGINVDYAYCANTSDVEKGLIIAHVSNPDQAIAIFGEG